MFEDPEEDDRGKQDEPKTKGWAALKSKKTAMLTSYVFSKDKKWTPATGKYVSFKNITPKHEF